MDNILKDRKLWLGVVIILSLVAFFSLAVWLDYRFPDKKLDPGQKPSLQSPSTLPEFLTADEKRQFGLDPSSQVQVLGREESGAVSVYKIIRGEEDLVDTGAAVESLSSRRGNDGIERK